MTEINLTEIKEKKRKSQKIFRLPILNGYDYDLSLIDAPHKIKKVRTLPNKPKKVHIPVILKGVMCYNEKIKAKTIEKKPQSLKTYMSIETMEIDKPYLLLLSTTQYEFIFKNFIKENNISYGQIIRFRREGSDFGTKMIFSLPKTLISNLKEAMKLEAKESKKPVKKA